MYRTIKCLFSIVLFLTVNSLVYSQMSPNISFLRSVPQSFATNPASEVPCRYWIGIPGLSSAGLSIDNTGFRYKDVFYRTPDDSLHFDVTNFLNTLEKNNYINVNLNEEILGFGFNIKAYYFDVRLTDRFSNSIGYSKDLMSFLFRLNGQFIGQTAEFSGTGLNMTMYHELSLGVRRKFNDTWSGGVRLKCLAGVANIYSRKTDMSLFTDPANAYAITVHSDLEINTSIPGTSSDKADSLSFYNYGSKFRKELSGSLNPGMALDLGVQYKLNEKYLFGLSLVDLGFITWKNNPRSYLSDQKNHDYTFEGIDINEFIGNDTTTLGNQLQQHPGNHPQRAFGPDEQIPQRVARNIFHALVAGPEHFAVRQHHLQPHHVIPRDPVFEPAQAARVLGHVAADRGYLHGPRVRRVEQPRGAGGIGDGLRRGARLRQQSQVGPVQLHDPVHLRQAEDNAVRARQTAAAQPRSRAARDDRRPGPVGQLQHSHDLFPGPREHHAARHLLQRSGPVKRVRNQVFLLREDIRSTQKAPQFGKCLLRE